MLPPPQQPQSRISTYCKSQLITQTDVENILNDRGECDDIGNEGQNWQQSFLIRAGRVLELAMGSKLARFSHTPQKAYSVGRNELKLEGVKGVQKLANVSPFALSPSTPPVAYVVVLMGL